MVKHVSFWPTTYTNRYGQETTTLESDGTSLYMVLRGTLFEGSSFTSLCPKNEEDIPTLGSTFPLSRFGELHACVFACELPLSLMVRGATEPGKLLVHFEVFDETRFLPRQAAWDMWLELHVGDNTFRSSHGFFDFEERLNEIQAHLPKDTYLQACIHCAFSDYSPAGHGEFGDLWCFRSNKQGYRNVTSKWDLFRLMSQAQPEAVQETYLCPEFEKRKPGTGYRG